MSAGVQILKEAILNPSDHGYTASTGKLQAREAISKAYSGANYQLKVSVLRQVDDIFMANGGLVALQFVTNAMVDEGDNILVPSFGYPYYAGLKEVRILKRPATST